MKLRLRSLQSKETIKLEVPNCCNLQQLQQSLSQSLFSTAAPLPSIHFSMNRKNELTASSARDLLQSFDITSGDLIYFSLNPNDFSSSSPETLGSTSTSWPRQRNNSNPHQSLNFQESEIPGPNQQETLPAKGEHGFQGREETNISDLVVQGQSDVNDTVVERHGSLISDTQMGETWESQELDGVEGMYVDTGSVGEAGKRFSEPHFLRRVLKEELVGDDVSDRKLLVIAIHAVFLESGFVGFDSLSGMRVDGFDLAEEWPSKHFEMKLRYTLPEILDSDNDNVESVVLRFQVLGHFVNIYGSLGKGGSALGSYRVCLNENRFAPTLNLVWTNYDKNDKMSENDELSRLNVENEVYEFWKIVKDGLALPLLIDLCEKTGLVLPPCLMRLPAELKFKILESLPALDIARIGCVCSEMRYFSSNNDLWKQKFDAEFGSGMRGRGLINWKEMFASRWECRKKFEKEIRAWQGYQCCTPFGCLNGWKPNPFAFPSPMIGGNCGVIAGLGVPCPFGQNGQAFPRFRMHDYFGTNCQAFQRLRMHNNFGTNCNLGGSIPSSVTGFEY